MFNRTTLPPASLTASRTDTAKAAAGGLSSRRRLELQRYLQLPSTAQGYFAFLACLMVLAFTMVLHITLSAEILRLDVRLLELKEEQARIEQTNANLVWQIAGYSTLGEVRRRAEELKYTPDVQLKYVVVPPDAGYAAQPPVAAQGSNVLPAAADVRPLLPEAQDPTSGRLLVLTDPDVPAEPERRFDNADLPAAPSPLRRSADNFLLWLREFVPGADQPAP